jgi:low affinity Fe/Cu permease
MNTEVALAITEGLVSDRESLKAWMTDIGLEITRITKNQISVKNPNNPDSKAIPLKGEFYEQNFRHSEKSAELKREASERYRREANSRYADCIERYEKLCKSKSEYHLERYATRDRTDSAKLTRQFTEQENEHTSEYKYNGENLNKDTQAMQESLQMQIQSMKKDLQTLNGLSQETAEQAKLKKALFSSNIVLVSIALILLISSICLGYVSKSKYNDISEMQNKVDYLKSQGGSMNIQKCGTRKTGVGAFK